MADFGGPAVTKNVFHLHSSKLHQLQKYFINSVDLHGAG
jgi:hypothetical protein